MRNTGQWFEKLDDISKEYLKQNKERIKEINQEITRLYERGIDTAGWLRKELSHERRLLLNENNKIRKGLIKY